MFSERGNDGIARDAAQWFKRHNPTAPAQGGARKSRAGREAADRHRPGRAGRRPSAGGAGGAGDRRDRSAAEGDL